LYDLLEAVSTLLKAHTGPDDVIAAPVLRRADAAMAKARRT
jgi:hypothetical protein